MSQQLKLIIQIPCFNEAGQIRSCLSALPKQIPGCSSVEVLVIDDGSDDGTADLARLAGATHVISHPRNRGLARAFMTGLRYSLASGADVIVNTDADNQYCADDIAILVAQLLESHADLVVGARPIEEVEDFSRCKKLLQRLGSWVVRLASQTDVADATSGFRAMRRDAAMRLSVFSSYTYTLETLIQAGQNNMTVVSVPVRVNRKQRESRLVKSLPAYVRKSVVTIVRVFALYRPFLFFCFIALFPLTAGLLLGMRFLVFYLHGNGGGHVQSLILMAILLLMGFQTIVTAFLADMLAANRRIAEETRYLALRAAEYTRREDHG